MKKYNIFLSIITIACLTINVRAQSNVNGWDKAKWDMNPNTVKSLYPSSVMITKNDDSNLFGEGKDTLRAKVKMDYNISDNPFEVDFIFNKANKLSLITLNYTGSVDKGFVLLAMLPLLIEKYGQPSISKETNYQWLNLSGGNITIGYLSFSKVIPLIISYEKKKASHL